MEGGIYPENIIILNNFRFQSPLSPSADLSDTFHASPNVFGRKALCFSSCDFVTATFNSHYRTVLRPCRVADNQLVEQSFVKIRVLAETCENRFFFIPQLALTKSARARGHTHKHTHRYYRISCCTYRVVSRTCRVLIVRSHSWWRNWFSLFCRKCRN